MKPMNTPSGKQPGRARAGRRWIQGGWGFAVFAVIVALGITRWTAPQPGFTDAYYHFNAATRLASGLGLTDPYLWTYINAPAALAPGETVPSHTYWMPMTSLVAAAGMWAFNAPGDPAAAQVPFALLLALTAWIGFGLGRLLGGSARHAWVAGWVTLFSGYFTRFWGATDTFAPYAAAGSLSLLWCGLGAQQLRQAGARQRRAWVWFALAGISAGVGHLTRADGVLLLIVIWAVALWPFGEDRALGLGRRIPPLAFSTAGYLVVMLPWFLRSLAAVGTILPVGGFQAAWFTEYNDLFNFPPDSSPATLFADGLGAFATSRWTAFTSNAGTFIAVEGLVVMAPLMLVGLWTRRRAPLLRGVWLYALGLHLVMTLVFPFPGYRGGLFHSAAALVPWWAALGVVGLDDVVQWVAQRRRTWKARTAKRVFSTALALLALVFSLSLAANGRVRPGVPALYAELVRQLPPSARLIVNDPAALYFFTGLAGVVLPNEAPTALPEVARSFSMTHLLIEFQDTAQGRVYAVPSPLLFDLESPPPFLTPVHLESPNARLYVITPP